MRIFFAMDLMDGQAVRLVRGDFTQKTVYSADPPEMIEAMKSLGAKDFHVIDLDGARTGTAINRPIIEGIRKRVDGYIEVGGGIRSEKDIGYYTQIGINGIIIGTKALTDPPFFEGLSEFRNIVLGLDVLEGNLMVKGWKEAAPISLEQALAHAEKIGAMALLCTNIARDGMLTGPDFDGLARIRAMTTLPVIASGGVSNVDDLRGLRDMGVWAAIVGKAFYEGRVRIDEAMIYAD
jgi:phosphoribosylformimino-5-aminoimidazole carboxamide ribotide isomerase